MDVDRRQDLAFFAWFAGDHREQFAIRRERDPTGAAKRQTGKLVTGLAVINADVETSSVFKPGRSPPGDGGGKIVSVRRESRRKSPEAGLDRVCPDDPEIFRAPRYQATIEE